MANDKDIDQRISDGYYEKGTLPYPHRHNFQIVEVVQTLRLGEQTVKGFDDEAYRAARSAYSEEQQNLAAQFRQDALEEVGLTEHPKADKAYDLAWERGHSAGLAEVLNELRELAELLNG